MASVLGSVLATLGSTFLPKAIGWIGEKIKWNYVR